MVWSKAGASLGWVGAGWDQVRELDAVTWVSCNWRCLLCFGAVVLGSDTFICLLSMSVLFSLCHLGRSRVAAGIG